MSIKEPLSIKEKVNILMVDDQPAKLLTYEVMLRELDENLIKSTSAREALGMLLRMEFAVVLLDVSMPQPPSTLRVAIDTGGTFTDCVWIDRGRIRLLKVFSTPADPAQAIAEAIRQIANESPVTLLHGTTVGTNSILQRKGARVALVTTKGFEDGVEIGRQARPKLYDFFFDRVEPLVPADLRFGIAERTDSEGKILEEPKSQDLDVLRRNIQQQHPDAIAVTLLFSFANPANELAIEEVLQPLNLPFSISHKILPEFREYERTSTVVVNAYLQPVMQRYLESLDQRLAQPARSNRIFVMSRLTEDLLTLARVESGEQRFEVEPTTPAELLNDAVESFRDIVRAQGMELTVEEVAETPVNADREAIHQVFSNLIENAMKYATSGKRIVLGARQADHGVEFYVRDFGPGIASEHLPRLFERFYRVDKARSRESGGTGLGLAIAKHIMLAHSGTIHAESELNHGSIFLFTLPAAVPA